MKNTNDFAAREGPRSCPRCGGRLIAALILGHVRHRCPEEACERARERRRAQQTRSARRLALGETEESPARGSVREMQRHYEHGAGFMEAVREAQMLLVAGVPDAAILEAVGFAPLSARILERAKAELRAASALIAAPNDATGEPARRSA